MCAEHTEGVLHGLHQFQARDRSDMRNRVVARLNDA